MKLCQGQLGIEKAAIDDQQLKPGVFELEWVA